MTIVQSFNTESLVVYYIDDFEGLDTIVNVDELAGANDFRDVLVVDIPSGS